MFCGVYHVAGGVCNANGANILPWNDFGSNIAILSNVLFLRYMSIISNENTLDYNIYHVSSRVYEDPSTLPSHAYNAYMS